MSLSNGQVVSLTAPTFNIQPLTFNLRQGQSPIILCIRGKSVSPVAGSLGSCSVVISRQCHVSTCPSAKDIVAPLECRAVGEFCHVFADGSIWITKKQSSTVFKLSSMNTSAFTGAGRMIADVIRIGGLVPPNIPDVSQVPPALDTSPGLAPPILPFMDTDRTNWFAGTPTFAWPASEGQRYTSGDLM